ncbi:MAG: putative transporter [Elusimicrobiota bacterium]
MESLQALPAQSVAYAVLLISLVAALGLALGNIRVRGVNLGIAGVLFAGIAFGHLKVTVDAGVLEFLREFGIILFVYTIGMQVGPGFTASLKKDGLRLNLLAGSVVVLGTALTLAMTCFFGIDGAAGVGIYAGAVTNTPSLAAAQQALKDMGRVGAEVIQRPGIGYAVAYPFGILGVILTMLLLRRRTSAEELSAASAAQESVLNVLNIEVENQNLEGLPIEKIPALESLGVRVSRVLHDGALGVAHPETRLHRGDVLLAIGPKDKLEELCLVVGKKSEKDLKSLPSRISSSRIIVTRKEVLGKTVRELGLEERYGVVITRAARADIEFLATADYAVQFGDAVLAVGEEEDIRKVADLMGNSGRSLTHPQLIPVFVGIALGVLVGQFPIRIPGMPVPVKLGLAGGPLLVAIALSRIRRIGPLSWYMPISANFMLRELGIILFLACVGLRAGDRFVDTLLHGDGLLWMACGSVVTLVPILAVAAFARLRMKMNAMTLFGLLAGSMTDPPALSFANSLAPSSAASIAYATVYPLVMLLRVVSAQVLIVLCPRVW